MHTFSRFLLTLILVSAPALAGDLLPGDSSTRAVPEQTEPQAPIVADPGMATRNQAWVAAQRAQVAERLKANGRLAGWPTRPLVDGKGLPAAPDKFLRRVAQDTWRGLDALVDKTHGLPLDRVEFHGGSTAPETARVGDYTNITNIGLHFLAVTAAHDLGFITKAQALERLKATLATLEKLETHRGFFFNYYNTTTLAHTSHFVSFVDSAWLTAGLMVARQAFPDLAARCTKLIAQGDYRFFYDAKLRQMVHGYYANLNEPARLHYCVFYTESRLGSLIAIGKGEAPKEHWFSMFRTLPPEIDWQVQQPIDRVERTGGGFHWMAGHYRWRDIDYVPSWGGSLFEALMPRLVLDEVRYAPDSLGKNGKIHTTIHRLFALEEEHYPVWGMSPSTVPGNDNSYSEFGVRPLGIAGYKSGVVTPHAVALALMADPTEATANLRKLVELYPIYGEFGFYDAVNPTTGEVSYSYLCLNQAMILVSLANYLADHSVQKRFAADPIVQKVLPLLAIEKFGG